MYVHIYMNLTLVTHYMYKYWQVLFQLVKACRTSVYSGLCTQGLCNYTYINVHNIALCVLKWQ